MAKKKKHRRIINLLTDELPADIPEPERSQLLFLQALERGEISGDCTEVDDAEIETPDK